MPIIGVIASSGDRNVPGAPTIGTATNVPSGRAYNNGRADVTFTAPTYTGGTPITGYTVTSSPGGFTGTGASSPISVTGLQSGVAYTFTVTATNAVGTGPASAASNSITATTVPQAPTIGTATDLGTGTSVSVAFTAGATGGSTITGFTATSSPGSITGTGGSSPITVSGLTAGTAYTFTVTATNANGTSAASAASNSVTPVVPAKFESIASASPSGVNTVTLSGIPTTYKYLELRMRYKDTATTVYAMNSAQVTMRFNGDTGSNYWNGNTYIDGNSSGTGAVNRVYNNGANSIRMLGFDYPANTGTGSRTDAFASARVVITGANETSTGKSVFGQTFKPGAITDANYGAGLFQNVWNGTAAITSITVNTASSFGSGSYVQLYGIKE